MLRPVSSSTLWAVAIAPISWIMAEPATSIPVTAWVTYRLGSSDRTFSAKARLRWSPVGVEPSGISLPML